jgi:hypothetical protein
LAARVNIYDLKVEPAPARGMGKAA